VIRPSASSIRRAAKSVDWAAIDALTDAEVERNATVEGEAPIRDWTARLADGRATIVLPLDVAAIRAKTKLSQEKFARAVQISPHTLRNWEQGRRAPEGPARALLTAIDRAPAAVMAALRER